MEYFQRSNLQPPKWIRESHSMQLHLKEKSRYRNRGHSSRTTSTPLPIKNVHLKKTTAGRDMWIIISEEGWSPQCVYEASCETLSVSFTKNQLQVQPHRPEETVHVQNQPPTNVLVKHIPKSRKASDHVAVLVDKVVDDERMVQVPIMTIVALRFSKTTRARIVKAGGGHHFGSIGFVFASWIQDNLVERP